MVQGDYLCTRRYDTGASFGLIFMKFRTLDAGPIVFGISQPNGTADMGENVPLNQFFCFHSAGMEFFKEKTL